MRKTTVFCLLCLSVASCSSLQEGDIGSTATHYPTHTPRPTFTPYPTYTPYPTPTPVTETWYHYRITYSISLDGYRGLTKVWMPVPVEAVTQKGIKLMNVSPEPADVFFEPKGNQIVFWQESIQDDGFEFSEQFEVYILKKAWDITPDSVGSYDPNDPVSSMHLRPSTMIQSDHPEIQATAQEIVGDETNPYRKIELIVAYLNENITSGGVYEDAVSVNKTKQSPACGGAAHMFVALSRAAGVPARVVTGIHSLRPGTYNWKERNFGTHMWAEFYLPSYGWIPIDPLWPEGTILAVSEGNRLILSKDSDIDLGYGRGDVPWFHMPHVNTQQEEGSALILTVELLGIEENPGY